MSASLQNLTLTWRPIKRTFLVCLVQKQKRHVPSSHFSRRQPAQHRQRTTSRWPPTAFQQKGNQGYQRQPSQSYQQQQRPQPSQGYQQPRATEFYSPAPPPPPPPPPSTSRFYQPQPQPQPQHSYRPTHRSSYIRSEGRAFFNNWKNTFQEGAHGPLFTHSKMWKFKVRRHANIATNATAAAKSINLNMFSNELRPFPSLLSRLISSPSVVDGK